MDDITYSATKIIQSEKNAVCEVEPLLFALKEQINFSEETFFNVLVAITEAVNNAVRHGNKCDPEKQVFLSIHSYAQKVVFVVRDQGVGFDPGEIDDPRKPENLLKEGGRGIFIIRSIADDVKIDNSGNGTVMTITFNIK